MSSLHTDIILISLLWRKGKVAILITTVKRRSKFAYQLPGDTFKKIFSVMKTM